MQNIQYHVLIPSPYHLTTQGYHCCLLLGSYFLFIFFFFEATYKFYVLHCPTWTMTVRNVSSCSWSIQQLYVNSTDYINNFSNHIKLSRFLTERIYSFKENSMSINGEIRVNINGWSLGNSNKNAKSFRLKHGPLSDWVPFNACWNLIFSKWQEKVSKW